jgi:hypothetical protein
VSVILDGELSSLADRADTQAKDIATPHLKRCCRIMPCFDEQPAKRQHRCAATHVHPERGATIRIDQLGVNCGLYRSVS